KGLEDGVVVGARSEVHSHYTPSSAGSAAKDPVVGIGRVESAGPDSALVRVSLFPPNPPVASDGPYRLRKGDGAYLFVRAPHVDRRSKLWFLLAGQDVTLLGWDNKKICDYRTLYQSDTAGLDDQLMKAILTDIHNPGHLQTPNDLGLHPLAIERRIGQSDLDKTSFDDLGKFLDYMLKESLVITQSFGREWKIRYVYSWWLAIGKPQA
ncbi:MAG: hypothetical protein JO159_07730, partial [Acidobacteria bacterium]|nr:hypothetical protein [Acidobacteriota bacterium]